MIFWYMLFAVVTAIVCHWTIFGPVLDQFRVAYPDDNISKYYYISHIIVLIGSIIFAPFLIFVYFSEDFTKVCREGFFKGLSGR